MSITSLLPSLHAISAIKYCGDSSSKVSTYPTLNFWPRKGRKRSRPLVFTFTSTSACGVTRWLSFPNHRFVTVLRVINAFFLSYLIFFLTRISLAVWTCESDRSSIWKMICHTLSHYIFYTHPFVVVLYLIIHHLCFFLFCLFYCRAELSVITAPFLFYACLSTLLCCF